MIERKWPAVAPVAFTANGTAQGKITVTSASGFKVKMQVILQHPTLGKTNLEIKRVPSPTTIELGPTGADISARTDLSAWDNTSIIFAVEQPRPKINPADMDRASFEEEPTVARRVFAVDEFGRGYGSENPLPVQLQDGDIKIDTLNAEIEVQLTAKDNDPVNPKVHDSVRIGDGVEEMAINGDGSINVNIVESPDVTIPSLVPHYNEVTAVPAGVETTLISMTGAPNGTRIQKIMVSGENHGAYRVKLDGSTIALKRTWWTAFNEEFSFEEFRKGFVVPEGSVLTVTVLHMRPDAGNFEVSVLSQE